MVAFHGSRMAYWIMNHLEAVMALSLCGKKENVKRGFDYLLTPNSMTARGGDNLENAVPLDEGLMHFSSGYGHR